MEKKNNIQLYVHSFEDSSFHGHIFTTNFHFLVSSCWEENLEAFILLKNPYSRLHIESQEEICVFQAPLPSIVNHLSFIPNSFAAVVGKIQENSNYQ